MFYFLGRGRPKTEKRSLAPPSPPPLSGQVSATQREMVRLTLHNVLKNHGIPGNWIACEVISTSTPSCAEAVLIQLVVLHWHDALMRYALALENAMLEGLKHFDAAANASKYRFAWKISPDCGCPTTALPESGFWSVPVAPIHPIPPAPVLAVSAATNSAPSMASAPAPTKPKFDLPPTAADFRDDDDDHGFAATQINDIQ